MSEKAQICHFAIFQIVLEQNFVLNSVITYCFLQTLLMCVYKMIEQYSLEQSKLFIEMFHGQYANS